MREHGVAPDFVGPHDKAALLIDAAANDRVSSLLTDRQGLTRDHGFIHVGVAFEHLAIERHFVARPNPQPVAHLYLIERHVRLTAVISQLSCRGRRKVQQRLDGAGGFLPGPELKHLAHQYQHNNDGGRLEVHGNRAILLPEGIGKYLRHQGRYEAVDQRNPGTNCDQGEHVQVTAEHRFPTPHKKWRTTPDHHRGGQNQLNPVRYLG